MHHSLPEQALKISRVHSLNRAWPLMALTHCALATTLISMLGGATALQTSFAGILLIMIAIYGAPLYWARQIKAQPYNERSTDGMHRKLRFACVLLGLVWAYLANVTFFNLQSSELALMTAVMITAGWTAATLLEADPLALWLISLPTLCSMGWILIDRMHSLSAMYLWVPIVTFWTCARVVISRSRAFISRSRMMLEKSSLAEQLNFKNSLLQRNNDSRKKLLAMASHDLRQPVHTMGLMLEQLLGNSHAAKCREEVQKIAVVLHTLSHTLDRLLDLARLESGVVTPEWEDVNLQELLGRLITEYKHLADRKGLELICNCPPLVGWSDQLLLEAILRNLLSNAVRYTPHGGVYVDVEEAGAGKINIVVRDSGPGIAQPYEHVFSRGFDPVGKTFKRDGGTGLGLAIVRRAINLLGHTMDVQSEIGQGSTFTIQLDHGRELPRHTETAVVSSSHLLWGATGIVIDNDRDILQSMRDLLQSRGARIVTVASYAEFEAKREFISTELDFIVADQHLDGPETGLDIIAEIRERARCAVPALLLTGDVELQGLKKADSGLQILYKPVSPNKLRAAVEIAVAQRRDVVILPD